MVRICKINIYNRIILFLLFNRFRHAFFLIFKMVHKVVICVSEIGVVGSSDHLLHLCVIDFIETAKFVLLEADWGRSFEMLDAVVLEWVLIGGGW
jgi:hypothetical protein